MSGLSLSILGPYSATLAGRPLGGFRTRLAKALLIYLACEPVRHRREHLMALLWPGLPQASAQNNLRQNLHLLRRVISEVASADGSLVPVVLADNDALQLNPAAAVAVDANRFAALIDRIRPGLGELEEAVALYRGDFLADFYLADSNPFEEWAAARREAYRRGALLALERLAAIHLTDEDFAAAENYARRQLIVDPLHETGHRQLIEILARDGRRSAALAHFDDYRRLLHVELGVKPGSETLALVGAVQAGELLPAGRRPDHIRGYDIHEELGRGSYGVVYRAAQPAIGRDVAIKVIPARIADDVAFIRRFEAEAQTIARLEHPQVVPLYDYWREPGSAYLVMRYLRGGNLKTALGGAPWALDRVARLLEQVAAALAVAPRNGIVHRDVKPANVLLDEDGNAYLSDFGIAKLLRQEGAASMAYEAFAGTPEYVSPEQALNEPVTPLSDQYSLGLVVYEALSGRPPFAANSLLELLEMHARQPLPPLREARPDVSLAIAAVLGRATAKRPADRFDDVGAFAQAFRAALTAEAAGEADAPPSGPLPAVDNPYKGLLAFTEADTALFHGREALTQQLVERLAETDDDRRFLAVVGPSGSGKSSLVRAGLVPALRRGALPGSEKWFVLDMTPGTHPYEELEAALLRIAVNPPASLLEQLEDGERGLLRAVRRILPPDGSSELLLIIDQFEELFTLVADRAVTARFLDSLVAAVTDPRSPMRVIVTLRADFYDRPLLYPGLSELMQRRTEVVVPLSTDELVRAIEQPAARAGVRAEAELVAALVADVNEQPGALPLLQYTLSELFEGRENGRLKLATYRRLGGISGALAQRAEAVYDGLDDAGQSAARALFSRLVTLGEGVEDTRRRVLRAELEALDLADDRRQTTDDGSQALVPEAVAPEAVAPEAVVAEAVVAEAVVAEAVVRGLSSVVAPLDAFGRARLLAFDRDPATRGPTVEIAHEALLRAWPRLRGWLDEDRAALRLSRLLTAAAAEWEAAGQDEGFLLRGARLNQLAPLAEGNVALTGNEQRYLAAGLAAREARRTVEEARRQAEIDTSRKLAETERQRANEQARSAGRLRRRAALLAGALGLAIVLAVAAMILGRQANENAALAQTSAAVAQTAEANALDEQSTAEAERVRAETGQAAALAAEATAAAEADIRATAEAVAIRERETAEQQTRLATSRELALASQSTLDFDTELSLLLALQALETHETKEATEALHQAVQASRTLRTIDQPEPGWDTVVRSPAGPLPTTVSATDITIWDPATTQPLYVLPGADFNPELGSWIDLDQTGERVLFFQLHRDDNRIDYKAWTLDNEQMIISQTLPIRLDERSNLAVSPDGQLLAVDYDDGTVGLWDSATGQQVALLGDNNGRHDDDIFATAFDQDGDRLAAFSSQSGQVSIWDVAASVAAGSGRRLSTFIAPDLADNGGFVSFAFIDETTVAAGSGGGWLQIWDLGDTSAPIASQVAHNLRILHIAVSNDRTKIATSSQAAIKIWSVPRGDLLLTLPVGVDAVYEVYFSPDSTELTTVDNRGAVRVWDARLHSLGETVSFEESPITTISHEMQVSPDGRQLAITSDFEPASLWDAATGELLKILADGEGATYGAGYSPDGTRLATVGQDDRIRVWDLANNEVGLSFLGESSGIVGNWWEGILDIAYSPDGSRLATAGGDGVAKVWDAQTGEELMTLTGHTAGLYDVVYSPDGRLIATAADYPDGNVRVWDVQTGEEKAVIAVGAGLVWGLAFSPDSTRLVTGSDGNGAQVWDATTGEEIFSLDREGLLIPDIAYTPDGSYLVTAGPGLRVWRAEDGEEVLALTNDHIWWVTISPDGRTVYGSDFRGVVRGFTLQLEDTVALAHDRLTRWWRPEECLAYLHTEECPAAPEGFVVDN